MSEPITGRSLSPEPTTSDEQVQSPEAKRCPGCYDSFSGPWCDDCDTWPCTCLEGECPVEECNLTEPHGLDAHDWTASPESRVAEYLRD